MLDISVWYGSPSSLRLLESKICRAAALAIPKPFRRYRRRSILLTPLYGSVTHGAMNRMHTVKRHISELKGQDMVPGTPAERIGMVWPLTREVASLSKRFDVERRLQRHVAGLGRREG